MGLGEALSGAALPGYSGQDQLLIFQDFSERGLVFLDDDLVAEDGFLISHNSTLVGQDGFLIFHDSRLVGQDCLLIG
jgi:hypothetical protein